MPGANCTRMARPPVLSCAHLLPPGSSDTPCGCPVRISHQMGLVRRDTHKGCRYWLDPDGCRPVHFLLRWLTLKGGDSHAERKSVYFKRARVGWKRAHFPCKNI